MGILLVPFGLSSAMFTLVLRFWFGIQDVVPFLLFMGTCIALVDVVGSVLLLEPPAAAAAAAPSSTNNATGFFPSSLVCFDCKRTILVHYIHSHDISV